MAGLNQSLKFSSKISERPVFPIAPTEKSIGHTRGFLKSPAANFQTFFACDFGATGMAVGADLGVDRA
jgi:hypothetical protein